MQLPEYVYSNPALFKEFEAWLNESSSEGDDDSDDSDLDDDDLDNHDEDDDHDGAGHGDGGGGTPGKEKKGEEEEDVAMGGGRGRSGRYGDSNGSNSGSDMDLVNSDGVMDQDCSDDGGDSDGRDVGVDGGSVRDGDHHDAGADADGDVDVDDVHDDIHNADTCNGNSNGTAQDDDDRHDREGTHGRFDNRHDAPADDTRDDNIADVDNGVDGDHGDDGGDSEGHPGRPREWPPEPRRRATRSQTDPLAPNIPDEVHIVKFLRQTKGWDYVGGTWNLRGPGMSDVLQEHEVGWCVLFVFSAVLVQSFPWYRCRSCPLFLGYKRIIAFIPFACAVVHPVEDNAASGVCVRLPRIFVVGKSFS